MAHRYNITEEFNLNDLRRVGDGRYAVRRGAKIRILKTRKRVPISPHVVNLSEEGKKWQKLTHQLQKRLKETV